MAAHTGHSTTQSFAAGRYESRPPKKRPPQTRPIFHQLAGHFEWPQATTWPNVPAIPQPGHWRRPVRKGRQKKWPATSVAAGHQMAAHAGHSAAGGDNGRRLGNNTNLR